MDFQRQKLGLAIGILAFGMLVSIVFHGWQGWVLDKTYPHNTFLFDPTDRYADFTNPYRFTLVGDPYRYSLGGANYFPATFLIFHLFTWLPPVPAAILFLNLCTVGLFVLLEAALRPILPHPGWRMLASIFFLWSYPFLFVLDRGNTEILLVLLVAGSLFFYSRKRFSLSFYFLFFAICFKLYPAILLLLFFRQRLFHWFFVGIIGFVLINWMVLITFPDTVTKSCECLLQQFSIYNKLMVLESNGIAAAASAWNLVRIAVWLIYTHFHHQPEFVGQLPQTVIHSALVAYGACTVAGLVLLTFYVLLVETSFPRRAILLLLFMTVSAPGGGDYKIMYVSVALIILLLTHERRPWDLVITGLLAFCLLPKREFLLTFMGKSDSTYYDASAGIILNPLCMLSALILLMWSGSRVARPFQFKRNLRKFASFIRFPGLRSLGAGVT